MIKFYKISMELYAAFNSFELDDISHMNAVSRHLEQSELTVESLTQRAFNPPEPVEEHVFRKLMYGELHKAIDMLPEVQRRRLLLYYFGGNTHISEENYTTQTLERGLALSRTDIAR